VYRSWVFVGVGCQLARHVDRVTTRQVPAELGSSDPKLLRQLNTELEKMAEKRKI